MSALTALKIALSVPIGIGLAYPFFSPEAPRGFLGELQMVGPLGAALGIGVFLFLVYLYARDLVLTLERVSPAARRFKPRRVWLMFLLPYNFVEDFFIVEGVARSLQAEAARHPGLARYKSHGRVSGIGWCAAQVLSLLPNDIGAAAGWIALGFWIWHWRFIRRVNAALAASPRG